MIRARAMILALVILGTGPKLRMATKTRTAPAGIVGSSNISTGAQPKLPLILIRSVMGFS